MSLKRLIGFTFLALNVWGQDLTPEQIEKARKMVEKDPSLLDQIKKKSTEESFEFKDELSSKYQFEENTDSLLSLEDSLRAAKDSLIRDSLQTVADSLKDTLIIYGLSLFEKDYTTQTTPDVPENYIVVPGDKILLRLWGRYNMEKIYSIGKDGYVFLEPFKKQTYLKGLTHRRVKQLIQNTVKDMPGVEGEAKVIASHPLSIHISGQAKLPGTVLIPPYYTFWQALMMSQGPSKFGSLRKIKLIRGSKTVFKFDIYDFLINGNIPSVSLKEGDRIHFDPIQNVVRVIGLVKRDGLYELNEKETIKDLIKHSSGYISKDISPVVHIERIIPVEQRAKSQASRRVIDVELSKRGWENFKLIDGDIISENIESKKIGNHVFISGKGIKIPGRYALTSRKVNISNIIEKAGGFIEGYVSDIEVVRNTDAGSKSFYVKAEVTDQSWKNFKVQAGDSILTYHQIQLNDTTYIKVFGFVRNDSLVFPYSEGIKLKNVVQRAGGIKDGGLPYVYVKRSNQNDVIEYKKVSLSESFDYVLEKRDEVYAFSYNDFNLKFPVVALMYGKDPLILEYSDDLNLGIIIHRLEGLSPIIDSQSVEINTPQFQNHDTYLIPNIIAVNSSSINDNKLINPGALIIFRKDTKKNAPKFIHLLGEFVKPGRYAIRNRTESLQSILESAGGLNNRANPYSLHIKRVGIEDKIPVRLADTDPIELEGKWLLTDGDSIFVNRDDKSVSIYGAVLNPGIVAYSKNHSWKDYVNYGAGGALDTADFKRTFIVYPNGTALKGNRGWFSSSRVVSGSSIYVPYKPYKPPPAPREPFSYQKFLAGLTGTLTAVLTIIIISKQI